MAKEISYAGSRFTKISAERKKDFSGKISLNTNIKINSIEPVKDQKEVIDISYSFLIDYGGFGKVELQGNLFVQADVKVAKSLINSMKEKKFDTDEHLSITNMIVQKATIKALEIEEELGLPFHIRLPTLALKKESD